MRLIFYQTLRLLQDHGRRSFENFYSLENLDQTVFNRFWIIPSSLHTREESFGCRWDRTQAACLTSDRFSHYSIAFQAY